MAKVKTNIIRIEKGKERLKESKKKDVRITKSVKMFLGITNLSLSDAIKRGYLKLKGDKYIVTSLGNKRRRRVK